MLHIHSFVVQGCSKTAVWHQPEHGKGQPPLQVKLMLCYHTTCNWLCRGLRVQIVEETVDAMMGRRTWRMC